MFVDRKKVRDLWRIASRIGDEELLKLADEMMQCGGGDSFAGGWDFVKKLSEEVGVEKVRLQVFRRGVQEAGVSAPYMYRLISLLEGEGVLEVIREGGKVWLRINQDALRVSLEARGIQ